MLRYEREKIRVRQSLPGDCLPLAYNLRQSDIDEIWASHNLKPAEAVKKSFDNSVICFTVTLGDAPIIMFGVCPFNFLGPEATIWMLATNDLKKVNRKFLKHSRQFIDVLLSYYPTLVNYVDARNIESIKWLRFCRAEIKEPQPYGYEKLLFHNFSFQRSLICA